MALKGDRNIWADGYNLDFFMNVTGEAGIIVTHSTAGSGASMDDGSATVVIPTGGASGTDPAGLLLCDVVNLDLTRQHLNDHKPEVQKGSKVPLLRHGWVVTNMIKAGDNPTAGNDAFYHSDGTLSVTNPMAGATSTDQGVNYMRQKVGKFLSSEDADGYCKVDIQIG